MGMSNPRGSICYHQTGLGCLCSASDLLLGTWVVGNTDLEKEADVCVVHAGYHRIEQSWGPLSNHEG